MLPRPGSTSPAGTDASEKRLHVACAVATTLIFVGDLWLPLGVAGGLPYIAIVVMSLWSSRNRAPLLAATAGTILTVIGFFLSSSGSALWIVVVNRALAIVALWVTGVLVLMRKRAETCLREACEELEARVEERTAELSTILKTALDGVITTDERGTIESFNPASERMFGYRADQVRGESIELILPDFRAGEDALGDQPAEPGGRLKDRLREVQGRRQDGSLFPLEIAISEFFLGDRRIFTGVLRDISDRRAAQRRFIEQASLAKLGEITAVVAHEVKSPLAGISAGLRMLKRRIPEGSDERRVIDKTVERVSRLNETIQDILRYASPRIPSPAAVPMHQLLKESLRLVSDNPDFSAVEVEFSGPDVTARCDADMMKPVFDNLVINAVEAMDGNGRLSVSVEENGASCPPGYFQISFRDTGPGVPPESRSKIFEPFYSTRPSGTGLGLAIAKRAIELHGGQIAVQGPPEGGAEFVVCLPLEPAKKSALAPTA